MTVSHKHKVFETEQSTSASIISCKSVASMRQVRGDGLFKVEGGTIVQRHLGTDSAFFPHMWVVLVGATFGSRIERAWYL